MPSLQVKDNGQAFFHERERTGRPRMKRIYRKKTGSRGNDIGKEIFTLLIYFNFKVVSQFETLPAIILEKKTWAKESGITRT